MVTGESLPVDKTKGDNVIGATINQDGILYIKATKVGKDTFLAHIIKLVEETQSEKIPIQILADKITRVFVPSILVLAALTFAGWFYFSSDLSKAILCKCFRSRYCMSMCSRACHANGFNGRFWNGCQARNSHKKGRSYANNETCKNSCL